MIPMILDAGPMESLKFASNTCTIRSLIAVTIAVSALFGDLDIIINDFILGNVDVGGLTANKDRGLHLQSYFFLW